MRIPAYAGLELVERQVEKRDVDNDAPLWRRRRFPHRWRRRLSRRRPVRLRCIALDAVELADHGIARDAELATDLRGR
jgi:hypothetical protein